MPKPMPMAFLALLGLLAAALIPARVDAGTAAADALEKIEHVVIIMQENRTFDQYFGTYPGAEGFPRDADGNITVCIPDPYSAERAVARLPTTTRVSATSAARTATRPTSRQ